MIVEALPVDLKRRVATVWIESARGHELPWRLDGRAPDSLSRRADHARGVIFDLGIDLYH
jgi:hypothetical protein